MRRHGLVATVRLRHRRAAAAAVVAVRATGSRHVAGHRLVAARGRAVTSSGDRGTGHARRAVAIRQRVAFHLLLKQRAAQRPSLLPTTTQQVVKQTNAPDQYRQLRSLQAPDQYSQLLHNCTLKQRQALQVRYVADV